MPVAIPVAAFERKEPTRLPILPLTDAVHFPCTDLWVQVADPAYQELVEKVALAPGGSRLIGTVLLKPEGEVGGKIFSAGTAGRVIDFEYLSEGGVGFVLRGEFRFELQLEVPGELHREALVERVEEPFLSELDPGIVALREELLTCSCSLSEKLGESFPLAPDHLFELRGVPSFEELVNSLASHLDLPPLRKQELLIDDLPERAERLLAILRSRRKIFELLEPYRHLARHSAKN